MKQGRASHSGMGATKHEPNVHKVSIAAVSQLGNKQGTHITGNGEVRNATPPLYPGRGLEAPMCGTSIHKAGSQGKHR